MSHSLLCYGPFNFCCSPTSGDIRFGPLKQEHAEAVFEHWGSSNSTRKLDKSKWLGYISEIIRQHPTACAYDVKTGAPLSWATVQFEGCGGMAYTDPSARGKRIHGLVGMYIAQKTYAAEFTQTFAYGAVTNTSIKKAVDNQWIRPDGYMFIGHYKAQGALNMKGKL